MIPIGNMVVTFANTNASYVAMGMNVETIAYNSNSTLLNVTSKRATNSEVKLTVDGRLKINTVTASDQVFTLLNNNSVVLSQNQNKLVSNVNTVVDETLYTRSYAEGAQFISVGANASVTIDLNKGTNFFIDPNGIALNNLTIIKPATFVATKERSLSCMLTFVDNAVINDSFWTSSGVVWPNGDKPPNPNCAKQYSLLYSPNFPENWFGFTNLGGKPTRYLIIVDGTSGYSGTAMFNVKNFLVERGVNPANIDYVFGYSNFSGPDGPKAILQYKQIWDLEYTVALPDYMQEVYKEYLKKGAAKLYLQSENLYFNTRNMSVTNFLRSLGDESIGNPMSYGYGNGSWFGFAPAPAGYAESQYFFSWNVGHITAGLCRDPVDFFKTIPPGNGVFLNASNGWARSSYGRGNRIAYTTTSWPDYAFLQFWLNWAASFNTVWLLGGDPFGLVSTVSAYWDKQSFLGYGNPEQIATELNDDVFVATVFDVNYLDVQYLRSQPNDYDDLLGVWHGRGPNYYGKNLLWAIFNIMVKANPRNGQYVL